VDSQCVAAVAVFGFALSYCVTVPAVAAPDTRSTQSGQTFRDCTDCTEMGVLPVLSQIQSRLFHEQGRPLGAALWVVLPEEAKLSLPSPRLRSDEWKSGDRCWLVASIVSGAAVGINLREKAGRFAADGAEGRRGVLGHPVALGGIRRTAVHSAERT
jgi:hypothetical protein